MNIDSFKILIFDPLSSFKDCLRKRGVGGDNTNRLMEISIKETVRALRRNQNSAEKVLWDRLRNRKLRNQKFVRQYPIIFGMGDENRFFVADFCCVIRKLIVEVDGGIHETQKEKDAVRDNVCQRLGYTVLRIKNEEVFSDIEKVLQKISQYLHNA